MSDQSRVDGKMDALKATDLASALRQKLLDASADKNGGNLDQSHRTFAAIAEAGALRELALVAEAEGDRVQSGILRINALDKSDGPTACPVGTMSLAAWDAQNRYPARAADILQGQIKRYPSLEAARYGLDVLSLRVSREQTRLPPG